VGVTGQQMVLTPSWHLILPSFLSVVFAVLMSTLSMPFGILIAVKHINFANRYNTDIGFELNVIRSKMKRICPGMDGNLNYIHTHPIF
jgi:hypothetical protein